MRFYHHGHIGNEDDYDGAHDDFGYGGGVDNHDTTQGGLKSQRKRLSQADNQKRLQMRKRPQAVRQAATLGFDFGFDFDNDHDINNIHRQDIGCLY